MKPERKIEKPSRKGSSSELVHPRRPRLNRRRLWMFRLLAMVLVPLLLLVVLELMLRLFGYGYPTVFALKRSGAEPPVFIQNDRFCHRFIPSRLARNAYPFALNREKPPPGYRIFILGGSAAQGDPDPSFSFGRMLQIMLTARYPGIEFEVVNAAVVAINSHVVRDIAEDCARFEPDLFVIYMGHNEVVGPYGAGTVFGAQTPSLALIRTQLMFKTTRIGQFLNDLFKLGMRGAAEWKTWGGMQMFLDQQVAASDPRLRAVYDHLQANLEAIYETALESGAGVVACTVASNLRHCTPFGSLHRDGLTGKALGRWEELYKAGTGLEDAGRHAEALEKYTAALAIDDRFADLHFRMGNCLESSGHIDEASTRYASALDLDTLRFRADSHINRIIRETAAARQSEGVHLVDVAELFGNHSAARAPGEEYFDDHVHLNFAGNELLARSVLQSVEALLPASIKQRPSSLGLDLTGEDLVRRMVYTDFSRYRIARVMLNKKTNPPFTNQLDHEPDLQKLTHRIDELHTRLDQYNADAIDRQFKEITEKYPTDWILNFNYATFLTERMNDHAAAARRLERVLGQIPNMPRAHANLGYMYNLLGRYPQAASHLTQALQFDPNIVNARNHLGNAYAGMGQTDKALAVFEELLDRLPTFTPARLNRANLLERLGRKNEALEQFREAVRNSPDDAVIIGMLGQALERRGMIPEAITRYRDAIMTDPADVVALTCLGNVYTQQGQLADAIPLFEEAVRFDPDNREAQFNLGAIYFEQGNMPQVIEHFSQVMRLNPDNGGARFKLAMAYKRMGRLKEAVPHFREILRRNPDDLEVLMSLADSLSLTDRLDQAATHYRHALELKPENPEIHFKLGLIHARQGKLNAAFEELERAKSLRADVPIVHFHLGRVLTELGRTGEAIASYREALRLDPDNSDYAVTLAWLLATHEDQQWRDGEEAVRIAQRACEQTGYKLPHILNTLAAAYAEIGRFEDAVQSAEKALSDAHAAGQQTVAETIERYLVLYRAGRPVREPAVKSEPGETAPPALIEEKESNHK